MFEISLSIVGVVFSNVVSCCSFLYSMSVCGTIVVFILRTMTKSLIIVDWFERSPVTYCYIIAHVRNTHPCRSCIDKLDFRKRSGFFLESDESGVKLFILFWIYYHLSTVLVTVRQWSTIRCKRCALCMSATRVWCACEIRQHSSVEIAGTFDLVYKTKQSFAFYWTLFPLFIVYYIE